jgi:hypothetical protein
MIASIIYLKKESTIDYKTYRNRCIHRFLITCSCDLKREKRYQFLEENYEKVTMSWIESGNRVEKGINRLIDLTKDFIDYHFNCIFIVYKNNNFLKNSFLMMSFKRSRLKHK